MHPPWYSELWFHFDADGLWLTAATLGLVCVAFADPRLRRPAAYALAAVAGIYPVPVAAAGSAPPLSLCRVAAADPGDGRRRGLGVRLDSETMAGRRNGEPGRGGRNRTRFARSAGRLGPDDYAVIDRALNDRGVPSDPVSRGEVASVLVGALGLPAAGDDYFSDDDGSAAHESSINALREAGIVSGCGDDRDRYCPTDPVTRGELASVLVGALRLPAAGEDHFTDDDGSAHEPSINALREAGITRGCRDGPDRYCPSRSRHPGAAGVVPGAGARRRGPWRPAGLGTRAGRCHELPPTHSASGPPPGPPAASGALTLRLPQRRSRAAC